ncbi:MAG: low molecular weight phosphotyrosine protein phosphatase [Gammaproteobacteria bacterium]|nr:low molecular weight phosphotyrosine protein phosphatase [Gammaproteobacteria bacterium]
MSKKIKVLFVCMGNICRSPTAEGVFRHVVEEAGLGHIIETDSAGTHAYHIGQPPDKRAQQTAKDRGLDISDLRARKAIEEDFQQFDYVLAMDADNYNMLSDLCPIGLESRLSLFLAYADELEETDVPDPYYGGLKGFEYVFDLVEAASKGLLDHIRKNHLD